MPRVASREHGPLTRRARTARLLRALIITAVAIGCLLAGTLTDAKGAAGTPGTVSRPAGGVTATLSYVRRGSRGSLMRYGDLRLTVRAEGRTTLRDAPLKYASHVSFGARPSLRVLDLTGDGVPDPIVAVYTGGAHCCSVSAVSRSTGNGWTVPLVRNWADPGYRLEDLGGSATPEFVTGDISFEYAYASYAASALPIRIWSLEGRHFTDVTARFPAAIEKDAADLAQRWQDAARESDSQVAHESGRATLAAWIADLARLGQYDAVRQAYTASRERGDFTGYPGFGAQLAHDLREWGYVTDSAVLGISDAPSGKS